MKKYSVTYMILSFLLPLVLVVLLIRTAYADVFITEVMYDPPGTDTGYEWVEIMNDGDVPADVQTLRFVEADIRHRIKESSGGTSIAPGASAVIVQDVALFRGDYREYDGQVFLSSFSLRQQGGVGESLGIYNTSSELVEHAVSYVPDDRASDTGASLHLTLSGTQVPAPATPGSIAINPIADQPGIAETVPVPEVEEQVLQQQEMPLVSEEIQSIFVKTVPDALSDVETGGRGVSGLVPQRQVVVMQEGGGGKNGTFALWLVVALLGIVVLELRVIARCLRVVRRVHRG